MARNVVAERSIRRKSESIQKFVGEEAMVIPRELVIESLREGPYFIALEA